MKFIDIVKKEIAKHRKCEPEEVKDIKREELGSALSIPFFTGECFDILADEPTLLAEQIKDDVQRKINERKSR